MNLFVADLLAILRSHPIVQSLRIVTLDETPSGRLELKVRCRLAPSPYQMQIWLHAEPAALDYAYQVFTDAPLLRWDNAWTRPPTWGRMRRSLMWFASRPAR
jgi:hypothetical protein